MDTKNDVFKRNERICSFQLWLYLRSYLQFQASITTFSAHSHHHINSNSSSNQHLGNQIHLFQRLVILIRQPISVGTKEPPNVSHQNTLFVFFRGFLQMRCLQLAFCSALVALLCSKFGAPVVCGTKRASYC